MDNKINTNVIEEKTEIKNQENSLDTIVSKNVENYCDEKIFDLIKKAKTGDQDAKTQLVNQNSPLIKSVIRYYKNKGVEYDDLFQLGCMGFVKAIKNFSFEFGVRFSTYAVPMIAGEVKRFLRDDGYIKISRSTKTLSIKINAFIDKYKKTNENSPSLEEVSTHFNMSTYDIIFAMDAAKSPLSLYDKVGEEDGTLSLMDKIAAKCSTDENIDKIVLKDLIKDLTDREKLIIKLRYFKDKTQSEVAKVLKVSQVQVSRLETRIINKIKSGFDDK